MMLYGTIAAGTLLTVALVVLGKWSGGGLPDNGWADAASAGDWAMFLTTLGMTGMLLGPRLTQDRTRAVALLPTLVFLARGLWGPLGPIPLVFHLVPTVAIWFGSLAAGREVQAWLARTMKR